MAAKLTRLTHEIRLDLVAESSTIYSSRSRQPVRKYLDTPSYCTLYITVHDLHALTASSQVALSVTFESMHLDSSLNNMTQIDSTDDAQCGADYRETWQAYIMSSNTKNIYMYYH